MDNLSNLYVPKLAYNGQVISVPLGVIGDKIEVDGVVLYQSSRSIPTLAGNAYSHWHILRDVHGNLIEYRGSSFYPRHSRVKFTATIKALRRGSLAGSIITIVKAPKTV